MQRHLEKNYTLYYIIFSGIILLFAIMLRISYLGETTLWFDEATYANSSFTDFNKFVENTRYRNSSPIILPFIYWIFGDYIRTQFLIRLLPFIFSILSIYILLNLPKVGLSKWVSITAALWITLLPFQIRYAQEVREYSLAVLVSSLLIFYFLKSFQQAEVKKFPYGFCILLFLAPFSSYGNIFIASVFLAIFIILQIKKENIYSLFVLSGIFCISILLSYVLVAQYQMHVRDYLYLSEYYPKGDIPLKIKWFISSNEKYLAFLLAGSETVLSWIISSIFLLVAGIFLIVSLIKKTCRFPEFYIVISFIGLIILLNILAYLRIYPFGSIRQHIFVSPLAIVAFLSAGLWIARKISKPLEPILIFIIFILIAYWSYNTLHTAYEENEDIISLISDINPKINDQNVFIFHEAIPAVIFHYPQRNFYLSTSDKYDIESMICEIKAMKGCQVYLVFTRTEQNQDKKIASILEEEGSIVIMDNHYKGTRSILIEKCH